jgi:acyl-CoA thioester hydrolase
MARVKVNLPNSFSFSAIIPVRITDLNYGNHVGNDSILSLIHEARVLFLKHHQLSELDFRGVGLIMADVAIEFKAELFYGDVLKVYVAAADFSAVGFDLVYKLVKNEEETIVAIAKTGMVCFDYTQKKVVKVPEEAKNAMGY